MMSGAENIPVANANVGVLGDLLVGLLGSLMGGTLDLICGGLLVWLNKEVQEGRQVVPET